MRKKKSSRGPPERTGRWGTTGDVRRCQGRSRSSGCVECTSGTDARGVASWLSPGTRPPGHRGTGRAAAGEVVPYGMRGVVVVGMSGVMATVEVAVAGYARSRGHLDARGLGLAAAACGGVAVGTPVFTYAGARKLVLCAHTRPPGLFLCDWPPVGKMLVCMKENP